MAEPLWETHGDNFPVFEIIMVRLSSLTEIRSPAYTFGKDVTEASLRESFAGKYTAQASTTSD